MIRQQLLLIQLSEELAEVQVSISKALRFGLDDGYPNKVTSNAEDIAIEFNEAISIFSMLENTDGFATFKKDKTIEIQEKKINRVNQWLKYSKEKGILKETTE